MQQFHDISPEQAWQLIQQGARLLDVRDAERFAQSHIPGAFHLTNQTFLTFQEQAEFDDPILIVCYHGISSRSAAQFLIEQGYDNVYSIIGGFDAWQRAGLPIET